MVAIGNWCDRDRSWSWYAGCGVRHLMRGEVRRESVRPTIRSCGSLRHPRCDRCVEANRALNNCYQLGRGSKCARCVAMGRTCSFFNEELIGAVVEAEPQQLSDIHLQLSELQSMLIADHHRSTAEAAAGTRRRLTIMERLRAIAERLGDRS